MGKKERDKGMRLEREFKNLVGGERVPLSGASGGSFTDDVIWPNVGRVEVKGRKNGWGYEYDWLETADIVAKKADRREWLVTMRLSTFKNLLKENKKNAKGSKKL